MVVFLKDIGKGENKMAKDLKKLKVIIKIKENIKTSQLVNKFTPIRFNKYSKGTVMRKHYDHIHSIFDEIQFI